MVGWLAVKGQDELSACRVKGCAQQFGRVQPDELVLQPGWAGQLLRV
eukprot:CAMPEP_0179841058 /NCGR_PEP_ID=MMETSP0982-20121206/2293_1 /TAXON_ID=483367 /ORGANISM="non described non described, Strain CCMP 2436" /LENGTH=46 /DNA_ID= /DNA_START= /DNA_END= /DNA_ORIENTATION=